MFQKILSVIFIFLLSHSAFAAKPECGSVLGETPFSKESRIKTTVFSMLNCEGHTEAFDSVENHFKERSEFHGYEFDWFGYAEAKIDEAVAFMKEDHSAGDGEAAWSEAKIEKVIELYTSPKIHKDIWLGEYADNYMSGTGITGLIFMQSKEMDKLFVIEKFMYAE